VSTNDEAVQVLKEAMESPSWWTNRAQLSAREVVRRLEEQGFTVARTSDVRVSLTSAAGPASATTESRGVSAVQQAPESDEAAEARAQDQARIASLMAEVESSMNAVRGAREAQSESPLTDEQRESA
jgi:hypothetical protein